ncbi:MAG: mitochondrial splicing system protein [Claussenomyces sp. TS43310]|nr:MAG: mitochondrial splicing system protein [Claussenomyces sp. TS43310]
MRRTLLLIARDSRPRALCKLRCYRSSPLQPSSVTRVVDTADFPPTLDIRRWNSAISTYTSSSESTIYALSTATGRAGIAIVRISGPACLEVYGTLCRGASLPRPRYASLRTLHDPILTGNILDTEALVLYFPATKTVTGEDVLELHIHGGPATVKAVLAAIPRCTSPSPIRYAEPGEFTRRAFQNNRLDLAQVEALSDTLSAETEQQRRSSIQGSSGALGRIYEEWRQLLLYARGEVEAIIDFSDDQDFDVSSSDMLQSIEAQIKKIKDLIRVHIEAGRRGELLRKGIRISMLGPPNTGKSSLLNRIAGREASIVSSEAGTTRDVVEVSFDMEGFLCTFADTAGLRSPSKSIGGGRVQVSGDSIGRVEQEGIRRAKMKAQDSDLIVVLTSIEPDLDGDGWSICYDTESLQIAADSQNFVVAVNKIDLVPEETLRNVLRNFDRHLSSHVPGYVADNLIAISCNDTHINPMIDDAGNIKDLVSRLVCMFKEMTHSEHEDLYGVTERQKQLLNQCSHDLQRYLEETSRSSEFDDGCDVVLAAEHLRSAATCLSRITGRGEVGDVEEVLGVVFEKYDPLHIYRGEMD